MVIMIKEWYKAFLAGFLGQSKQPKLNFQAKQPASLLKTDAHFEKGNKISSGGTKINKQILFWIKNWSFFYKLPVKLEKLYNFEAY